MFNLKAISAMHADCSVDFRLEFTEPTTFGEFVSQVLSRGEWGHINIDDGTTKKEFDYNNSTIDSHDKFDSRLILSGLATGNYSRMDYKITLDKDKSKFDKILSKEGLFKYHEAVVGKYIKEENKV